MAKNNLTAYHLLDKRFIKSKREDNTKRIMDAIDKDLDVRDRWMGIRQLKQVYQPHPYARRTTDGKHIPQAQRAQKAADYLSTHQWGKRKRDDDECPENQPPQKRTHCTTAIPNSAHDEYNIADISLKEIKFTLKKMKRRKAPGPDEIPMEIVKEMDDQCLTLIVELLNSCLLYTSPSPRDKRQSRMPSSA